MAFIDNRKLNTREAAAYLSTSPSTLNKRRLTGDGPMYLKIGHLVRYEIEDLDAYARRDRRQHTSKPVRSSELGAS
jgi:Helix-turn-helix domain